MRCSAVRRSAAWLPRLHLSRQELNNALLRITVPPPKPSLMLIMARGPLKNALPSTRVSAALAWNTQDDCRSTVPISLHTQPDTAAPRGKLLCVSVIAQNEGLSPAPRGKLPCVPSKPVPAGRSGSVDVVNLRRHSARRRNHPRPTGRRAKRR